MDLMAVRRRLLMMAAAVRRVLHTITSAAGIVSFSTELAEPLETLSCELAPVQPGGDPSPNNILPISGWTGLSISRATDGFLCVPQSGTHWEVNGIVCDYIGNGTYWVRGTATATANINIPVVSFTIPSGDGRLFEMKNNPAASGATLVFLTSSSTQIDSWGMTSANRTSSGYSAMAGKTVGIVRFAHTSGRTVDYIIAPTFTKYKQTDIPVSWTLAGYRRLKDIIFDGNVHYESSVYLQGSDVVTMTITPGATSGMNVFGCYSGTGSSARNFSFYNYQSNSSNAYFRYGTVLLRPNWGTTATRTVSFGSGGTDGFRTDVDTPETSFTTTDAAWIGMLPNSTSAHFSGTITGSIKVGNRLEFIPVERNSDGVIGYYDTLNDVFLEPVGSGTPSTSGYDETDPGPVYGGTLDVVTGVLTVTHSFWTADKNQEWLYSSGWSKTNTACFYVNGQTDVYYPNDTYLSYTHCDEFKCYTRNQLYSSDSEGIAPSGGANNTAFTLRIAKSRASTVEELKTWLESNPIHVVFVRKTPLTYQLTPAEVSAIIGSNTIWHDAFGGITVSYYDTK